MSLYAEERPEENVHHRQCTQGAHAPRDRRLVGWPLCRFLFVVSPEDGAIDCHIDCEAPAAIYTRMEDCAVSCAAPIRRGSYRLVLSCVSGPGDHRRHEGAGLRRKYSWVDAAASPIAPDEPAARARTNFLPLYALISSAAGLRPRCISMRRACLYKPGSRLGWCLNAAAARPASASSGHDHRNIFRLPKAKPVQTFPLEGLR